MSCNHRTRGVKCGKKFIKRTKHAVVETKAAVKFHANTL